MKIKFKWKKKKKVGKFFFLNHDQSGKNVMWTQKRSERFNDKVKVLLWTKKRLEIPNFMRIFFSPKFGKFNTMEESIEKICKLLLKCQFDNTGSSVSVFTVQLKQTIIGLWWSMAIFSHRVLNLIYSVATTYSILFLCKVYSQRTQNVNMRFSRINDKTVTMIKLLLLMIISK